MKNILLLITFSLISVLGVAQLSEKVAEKYFTNLSFVKALEYYEDLASGKSPTKLQTQRAAESAHKVGDLKRSEYWYNKLYSDFPHDIPNLIQFAYILKQNGNYGRANEVFKQIFKLDPTNSVAIEHLSNINYYQDLKDYQDRVDIRLTKYNTGYDEFSPSYIDTLSKEIVFVSNRKNEYLKNQKTAFDQTLFLDIYKSNADSLYKMKYNKELNTKYHDGPVSFSNNGTVMYLTRNNYINDKVGYSSNGNVNLKIYISKKSGNAWGEFEEFKYNSDQFSCGHASVSEDGNIMYFISDMPETKGQTDIFKSELINGEWSKPISVPGINTVEKEMFPFLTSKGVLFFSSYGRVGLGGLDIYRAYPTDTGFIVANVGYPMNSNKDDFGVTINKQEEYGFFSSNRSSDSSSGGDDIYSFSVNYPFDPNFHLRGRVVEQISRNLLPETQINLVNLRTGKVMDSLVTSTGEYEFKNLLPGKYKVTPQKTDHFIVEEYIVDSRNAIKNQINNAYVVMQKERFDLVYEIVNGKSGREVVDAKITIINRFTGQEKVVYTNVLGKYLDSLKSIEIKDSTANFTVTVSKDGFFDRIVDINQKFSSSGTLKKSITLIPFEAIDIAKMCLINEIYYDLGKWDIREDAALELDKLIKCMKENPTMSIEIGSHTDCRGSDGFNQSLSDKRAKSCMKYVISKGISSSRISGKGYGESKLINECNCEDVKGTDCSEERHQENRRTEFRVII